MAPEQKTGFIHLPIGRKKEDPVAPETGRRGVLVAVGGNELDQTAIRLACRFAKDTKTPIYAVHVIEMPWTEAVDAPPSPDATI